MRCRERFRTYEDLRKHLTQGYETMCRIKDTSELQDEESGRISTALEAQLRSRAEADRFDWIRLWQALFPRDKLEDVPPPGTNYSPGSLLVRR